jgi:hypothetical protein
MKGSLLVLVFGGDADKGYQGAGRFTGQEKRDGGAWKPLSPTGLVEKYTVYYTVRPRMVFSKMRGMSS